ncbi:hypothetical protein W97_05615 [Coniosporium apollinis CBS 100218]|uniref:Uncharacterized protein n=1 Tax=Coniosporium apollinis (strain CBS 100218) TaxID=1168221 RepID=R7YWE0_CONA1|nr:uncharacterized protein W97_05615 [Coniosporium apollinis CBS 100218]EON66222.1 hypothetical protein W97_05615 [Coniosporium apollinis CBS 100218]
MADPAAVARVRADLQSRLDALSILDFLCCMYIVTEWRGGMLTFVYVDAQQGSSDVWFRLAEVRIANGAFFWLRQAVIQAPPEGNSWPEGSTIPHPREVTRVQEIDEKYLELILGFLDSGKVQLPDGSCFMGMVNREIEETIAANAAGPLTFFPS